MERIELFVAHHILDLIQAVMLPVLSLIVLFWIDWRLALGVLFPLPLAMGVQMSMYGKKGMRLYTQWQEKLSAMNGTIVEYIRGMPVVKIFNQTVGAFKRFFRRCLRLQGSDPSLDPRINNGLLSLPDASQFQHGVHSSHSDLSVALGEG